MASALDRIRQARNEAAAAEGDQRDLGGRRIAAAAVAAFATACVAYIVAFAPFRPWPLLWWGVYDDAGYYFQIGRNIARGLGPTFDGTNPTNGFQPLWQAVISIMQIILPFKEEPENFVRAVLLFQGLLLTAALVVFNGALRFLQSQAFRWFGVVLFLIFVCLKFRDGMESALVILLAALVVYLHARNGSLDRWSKGQCVIFGVSLGGLMLARLDGIFWAVPILGILVLMGGIDRGVGVRLGSSVWIGVTCSAVLIPYLVANYVTFGHFTPISGALKSSFPVPGYFVPFWTMGAKNMLLVVVAVVSGIVILIWERGPWLTRDTNPLRGPVCALAIGVLIHVGYEAFFVDFGVYPWHFALEVFALCLFLPYLCLRISTFLSRPHQRLAIRTIGTSVVVLAVAASSGIIHRDWAEPGAVKVTRSFGMTTYRAAQWVNANLPANAVIGMLDSGTMGFFCGRPVVNLDGLVNSYAYQDAIREGRIKEFLRENGVDYYARASLRGSEPLVTGNYSEHTFAVRARLYRTSAKVLELKPSDEVYRAAYNSPGPDALVIWRIPQGGLAD